MIVGRRRFLQGAAVIGAAAAAGALPLAAEAQEQRLHPERVTFDVPGLDPAHDGLRVAQLSDVHIGPRTSPSLIRAAIAEAEASRPPASTDDELPERKSLRWFKLFVLYVLFFPVGLIVLLYGWLAPPPRSKSNSSLDPRS